MTRQGRFMNISDLVNIIEAVALIYFAYQQNQIFRHQNQILATQGGQPAMLSNGSRLLWLRRYWPTMMMVFVILLVGFDIYDRHHGFGYDPERAWDDSKPLERVYRHTFENETVVLDNKHLVGPNKFDNVTIIYNGLGPFAVDDPKLGIT